MPKTLREQLEESFENVGEKEGGSDEDTEESLGDTEQSEEEKGEGGKTEEKQVVEEEKEDVRQEDTVSGEGEEEEGERKEEEVLEVQSEQEPEPVEDLKAPVSWKPAIREHWNTLPQNVKQEVLRREQEIQRGLQQASGHKKVAEEYVNVVRPFEHLIRAQNSTPSEAITNLMQTAARLTLGTPTQKAEVVTEIIKNYGIDIETLDQVLSGAELPNSQNDPLLQQIDKKLEPITSFMQQFQETQSNEVQKAEENATMELQNFQNDPKNEFFEDVREDMADLIELSAKRGISLSIEDAYDRACQNNPEIRKVLDQRSASLRQSTPVTPSKKEASSSIPSEAPTGVKSEPGEGTLRDSIAAAMEDLSG